jgi:ankyrin repeat protein
LSVNLCTTSYVANFNYRFVKGLKVLYKLIKAGINLDKEDNEKRSPIMWAASSGSAEAIKGLYNAGANPFTHEKDGMTALHCAASKGHYSCIEVLIDVCKCYVDMMDNNNCTPIFYAATIGHREVCERLIEYGANLYVQDIKGRT